MNTSGVLVVFYESTKHLSEEEKRKYRVTDKKGDRVVATQTKNPSAKYGHLVESLGQNDGQLQAARIYFGRDFGSVSDFYQRQCMRMNLKIREDNLYSTKIIIRIEVDGYIWSKEYVWRYITRPNL